MAYTNATFFMDPDSGSDSARTALTSVSFANNGSGGVRATKAAHGLVTGAVVDVTASTNYNAAWKVTVIDSSNFDLDTASHVSNQSGTVTPRGGASLADAWKTIASGPTTARTAAGDTVRVKASPAPTSLGVNGTWTDGPLKATGAIASSTNATPIVVTLSGATYTALAPVVGDTVQITGHTTNTNANGVWKLSAVNGSTTVTLVNADGTNSVGNGIGSGSGTIRKINNRVVMLASAVTKNIAVCGNQGAKTNWTPSTNVTDTVVTSDWREGGECQQIAIGASFTTGLAAFFATGTLDLSGFQQVSFWIKQTVGTQAVAGDYSLTLCTDTSGAVPVHTIAIPAIPGSPWQPVTVDLAGAMNSAIKSIAFVVNVDHGAVTFLIDNIIACKASASADSLSLTSLIGKNTSTETWWAIQSINSVRVVLDMVVNTLPNSTTARGYSGTSETVTAYKRETNKVAGSTTWGTPAVSTVTFSGGWNRSDMTTQTDLTWMDGQNGAGAGLAWSVNRILSIDHFGFSRFNTGLSPAASGSSVCKASYLHVNNCSSPINSGGNNFITATAVSAGGVRNEWGVAGPVWICANNHSATTDNAIFGRNTTARFQLGDITILSNGGVGCELGGVYATSGTLTCSNNASDGIGGQQSANNADVWDIVCNNNAAGGLGKTNSAITSPLTARDVTCSGNATYGFSPNGSNSAFSAFAFRSFTARTNGTYGLDVLGGACGSQCSIGTLTTSGNTSGAVRWGASECVLRVRNWSSSSETLLATSTPSAPWYQKLYSAKHGADATDNRIYYGSVLSAKSQTTTRHTASGVAWQFLPTFTDDVFNSLVPMREAIAQIAVAANALVTVKCWIQRDNTGITAKLTCRGGQIAGVTDDASVTASGSANTWQEETLTFTPTEAGVVEICAEVYGGTTFNAYYDDLTVTQA